MFRKILAVAACAFAAVASAEGKLQFTQTPANAQVGVASTITWAGGEDGPVTLTLRKGPDSNNLATIGIITGKTLHKHYARFRNELFVSRLKSKIREVHEVVR